MCGALPEGGAGGLGAPGAGSSARLGRVGLSVLDLAVADGPCGADLGLDAHGSLSQLESILGTGLAPHWSTWSGVVVGTLAEGFSDHTPAALPHPRDGLAEAGGDCKGGAVTFGTCAPVESWYHTPEDFSHPGIELVGAGLPATSSTSALLGLWPALIVAVIAAWALETSGDLDLGGVPVGHSLTFGKHLGHGAGGGGCALACTPASSPEA